MNGWNCNNRHYKTKVRQLGRCRVTSAAATTAEAASNSKMKRSQPSLNLKNMPELLWKRRV